MAAGVTTHFRYVDPPVRDMRHTPGARDERHGHADRPLIVIHGLGCSSDAWLPAVRDIARSGLYGRIIAPDLPGSGRSDKRHKVFSIDETSDWLSAFMEALGIPSADVAGQSLGCQVALALARNHPNRVESLTLVGPTTGRSLEGFWRYAAGLAADAIFEPAAYNVCLASMYRQMGIVRYLRTVRKMLQDKPLDDVSMILQPCLVLRGEYDQIVPERVARELAEMLPAGQYRGLKKCAHALQFERPQDFTAMQRCFLIARDQVRCVPIEARATAPQAARAR